MIFAHPRYERSRTNKILLRNIDPAITFHDLYELYPDFNIDLEAEKKLLLEHDIIIWHHPLYWYSCPPLLKQWIDIVLELGWAYGAGGTALKGKQVFNAITSGGAREVYTHGGKNHFTLNEFFAPFEQTARLCNMTYLPPFAVQGTHRLNDDELEAYAAQYHEVLARLSAGVAPDELKNYERLNDWITSTKINTL